MIQLWQATLAEAHPSQHWSHSCKSSRTMAQCLMTCCCSFRTQCSWLNRTLRSTRCNDCLWEVCWSLLLHPQRFQGRGYQYAAATACFGSVSDFNDKDHTAAYQQLLKFLPVPESLSKGLLCHHAARCVAILYNVVQSMCKFPLKARQT